MHSLFEPNLASPAYAYDEYSIFHRPLHLPKSSSKQLPACAGHCIFWCVQRSLQGSRPRFHPLSGLAAIFRLSPAVLSVNLAGVQLPAFTGCLILQLPATNSDAPQGHQLRVTLDALNLWMQVQKSSEFVDFTRIGAYIYARR